MLELFTIPRDVYKPYFDIIALFRDEVEFNVMERCVRICSADRANAGMIENILKITPKEQCTFKLSIAPLLKISPSDDIVFWSMDNKIVIKEGKTTYKITTLDDRLSDVKTANIPDKFTYKCKIALTSDMLKEMEAKIKVINTDGKQRIDMVVTDKMLKMQSPQTEELSIDHEVGIVDGEDCISRFGSEYLLFALKYHKLFDDVVFHIGHHVPCKFEMKSPLIDTNILIAPRIEEGDV